jgi:hypothetical protein
MTRNANLTQYKATLVAGGEEVNFIKAAEGDSGPGKFSGVGYSGGMVPGYTASPKLDHPYVIDLSGTKKSKHNHVNLDHKPNQRVGHLTEAVIGDKQLTVEGVLSAETKYRDEVAGGARNGQPWELSIEGNLGGREFVPRGKTAVVNGQEFSGPFYRMTKNTFTDIAFVSHGADGGNEVKIAASTAGDSEMNEFEKFMVS